MAFGISIDTDDRAVRALLQEIFAARGALDAMEPAYQAAHETMIRYNALNSRIGCLVNAVNALTVGGNLDRGAVYAAADAWERARERAAEATDGSPF